MLSVGANCGLIGMAVMRHRMIAERERGDRHADREGARLADRLELANGVRESFLKLQRELVERVHKGKRQIDAARRELRRELIAPAADRAHVEELLVAIGREQDALDRALVDNVLAARELLEGPAEREYLRFIERFGGEIAGPRAPGPSPGPTRPRFGGRKPRGPDGPP
jgi:hypothetical protein